MQIEIGGLRTLRARVGWPARTGKRQFRLLFDADRSSTFDTNSCSFVDLNASGGATLGWRARGFQLPLMQRKGNLLIGDSRFRHDMLLPRERIMPENATSGQF